MTWTPQGLPCVKPRWPPPLRVTRLLHLACRTPTRGPTPRPRIPTRRRHAVPCAGFPPAPSVRPPSFRTPPKTGARPAVQCKPCQLPIYTRPGSGSLTHSHRLTAHAATEDCIASIHRHQSPYRSAWIGCRRRSPCRWLRCSDISSSSSSSTTCSRSTSKVRSTSNRRHRTRTAAAAAAGPAAAASAARCGGRARGA